MGFEPGTLVVAPATLPLSYALKPKSLALEGVYTVFFPMLQPELQSPALAEARGFRLSRTLYTLPRGHPKLIRLTQSL